MGKPIFKDQTNTTFRGTSLYLLPYVPEIDQDLNALFTDSCFEEVLDMPKIGKKVNLRESAIIFEKHFEANFGLGYIGSLQKLGFYVEVEPQEYQYDPASLTA